MTDEKYLIVRRGLYYRPNSAGYTGLKSEAGRYSFEDVAPWFPNREGSNRDGLTLVAESDAPEYSVRCPWDVRMKREAFKEGHEAGRSYPPAVRSLITAARAYRDDMRRIEAGEIDATDTLAALEEAAMKMEEG